MNAPDRGQSGVRIRCSQDGSRATIDFLPPVSAGGEPIRIVDVQAELTRLEIVAGIDWPAIEQAVGRAATTGQAVRNVVVARATAGQEAKRFLGAASIPCAASAYASFLEGARWAGEAFHKRAWDAVPAGLTFVREGDRVLRIEAGSTPVDIHGRTQPGRAARGAAPQGVDGIREEDMDSGTSYFAVRAGYVALTSHGQISVIDPLVLSADRMVLQFALLPVSSGEEALQEHLLHVLHERRALSGQASEEEKSLLPWQERLRNRQTELLNVGVGTPPTPGTPGRMRWQVDLSGRPPPADGDERVVYAEASPFVDVEKGALLAEWIPASPGTPGRDALGNPLPASATADGVRCESGENVVCQETEGAVAYRAGCSGIVRLQGNRLSVVDTLILRGDVGPATGNLRLRGDLAIQGDIRGGYAVFCGGNLKIDGSVENGARIECGGDLEVRRGIFGPKTLVHARGQATVGFVQDSRIEVDGSLAVRDYILGSEVFCRGELHVEGMSVRGNDKGAVMGGHVSAMAGMRLHSVGTANATTRLSCGIDERMLAGLQEVERLLPLLAKRMVRLQAALGFDAAAPDAALRIAKLPAHRKSVVRELLLELHRAASQREEFVRKAEELRKGAVAPNLQTLTVDIARHLVPTVMVRLGDARTSPVEAIGPCRFRVGEGGTLVVEAAAGRRNDPRKH